MGAIQGVLEGHHSGDSYDSAASRGSQCLNLPHGALVGRYVPAHEGV